VKPTEPTKRNIWNRRNLLIVLTLVVTWFAFVSVYVGVRPDPEPKSKLVVPPVPDDPAAAPVPRAQLMHSAALAGDYLARAAGRDGRFAYRYDPQQDEVLGGYSMAHHAAAVFAMLELYEQHRDEELRAAAQRALLYLLTHVYDLPLSAVPKARMVEDGWARLGGAAVTVLAISEYARATGDRTHLPQAVKLANWMCSLVRRDGSFRHHEVQIEPGRRVQSDAVEYPGQVIMALMRLNEVEPNEVWVTAAARVADYVINVRDAGATELTQPQDHWLLRGLAELGRVKSDAHYLDHAEWIARVIAAAQVTEAANEAWVGGFDRPPLSIPAAARLEGLAAVYPVLYERGRRDYLPLIRACLNRGVRFELRYQYDEARAADLPAPRPVAGLPDPARARGGFATAPDNPRIRIDAVQHNVSLLVGLWEMEEQGLRE